ncbi:MAG: beta-propeller fold lactonase family protein [Conexibacter sp.]
MRSPRLVAGMLLVALALIAAPANAAPVGQLSYASCWTGGTGCPTSGIAGMADLTDVAVSPDGRNVYVTSYTSASIARFDRDPATGTLTPAGCITSATGCGAAADGKPGLDGARSVAVSADGRSVYVTGETVDAVTAFARDTSTGALSYVGCITGAATGCTGARAVSQVGLDSPEGVAVSPDGNAVFVASYNSNALVWFRRDAATSALTYDSCSSQGGTCAYFQAVGLTGPEDVTVSPDNANVYVSSFGSSSVARFTRDPQTGGVSLAGCHTSGGGCFAGGNGVASLTHAFQSVLDPTGRNLYTVSHNSVHALTTFDRSDPFGALTFSGCFDAASVCGGDHDGIALLLFPSGLAISADGRSVYVSSGETRTLMRFNRDPRDGTLARSDCFTQATGCGAGRDGLAPLAAPFQLAVPPDGRDLYVQTGGKLLDFRRVTDEPPTCAPPSSAKTTPGTSVRIALGCGDANGDAFTVGFPAVPAHGALTRSADGGSVLYVPDSGYRGNDRFDVQAIDAYGVAGPIARVSVSVAPAASAVPKLSQLALAPARFRAAGHGGSIAAAHRKRTAPIGTTMSYRLDRAARVTFTVTKRLAGVRRNGRCVAAPRKRSATRAAKAKRCTRTLTLGAFAHSSRAGASSFRFTGRVKGKALTPGRYALTAVAKAADGSRGAPVARRFAIVR